MKNAMLNEEMKNTMKNHIYKIYLLESRNYMQLEDF